MSTIKAGTGKFKGYAIVRDAHGNIIVHESVFYDPEKLEKLRKEVLKDGRNSYDNRS